MFDKPNIDWQAAAAKVQALMAPIDFDFECRVSRKYRPAVPDHQ